MTHEEESEYLTRNSILKLLTDEENETVSMAESAVQLAAGAEYIDLEQLERGVQLASATMTPMGRILPRSAVHQQTWAKILSMLASSQAAAKHLGT